MNSREIRYYTTPRGHAPAKEWLDALKDELSKAILYKRIRQAGLGQLGHSRSLGSGVFELKVDFGPGFRIYFGNHGEQLLVILLAGSKRSQNSDIVKAKAYWIEWKARHE